MSKYIDVQSVSVAWEPEDKETYGDDFMGGVMYTLDYLKGLDEEHEFVFADAMLMRKKALREEYKRLFLLVCGMSERLTRYESKLAQRDAANFTAVKRGELLEKVAGLFRPSAEEAAVEIDNLILNKGFLMRALAHPWAFTEEQATEFIDLVDEVNERFTEEWGRKGGRE